MVKAEGEEEGEAAESGRRKEVKIGSERERKGEQEPERGRDSRARRNCFDCAGFRADSIPTVSAVNEHSTA